MKCEKKSNKLAVFMPGLGYTPDRPLLYYSRKMLMSMGYDICVIPFDLDTSVIGSLLANQDPQTMHALFTEAREQTWQAIVAGNENAVIDTTGEALAILNGYEEVVFVGKSIGTVVAAKTATEVTAPRVRLVLYTPLEQTLAFPIKEAVVFTGLDDPWVGREKTRIPAICHEKQIPCYTYLNANHSLETGGIAVDLSNLSDIMEKTKQFLLT